MQQLETNSILINKTRQRYEVRINLNKNEFLFCFDLKKLTRLFTSDSQHYMIANVISNAKITFYK